MHYYIKVVFVTKCALYISFVNLAKYETNNYCEYSTVFKGTHNNGLVVHPHCGIYS